jgi:hypothetical protein
MFDKGHTPAFGSYDTDEFIGQVPVVPVDYDLYGSSVEADMLLMDRVSVDVQLADTALLSGYILTVDEAPKTPVLRSFTDYDHAAAQAERDAIAAYLKRGSEGGSNA